MYVMAGIGEAAPFACPPCAYFNGQFCAWCPDTGAENIPDCDGCKNRERERKAWYASPDFLVPVASTVVAAVLSAVLLSRLRLGR